MTTSNNFVTTLPYPKPNPFTLCGLLLHDRSKMQWRCKRQSICVVR